MTACRTPHPDPYAVGYLDGRSMGIQLSATNTISIMLALYAEAHAAPRIKSAALERIAGVMDALADLLIADRLGAANEIPPDASRARA